MFSSPFDKPACNGIHHRHIAQPSSRLRLPRLTESRPVGSLLAVIPSTGNLGLAMAKDRVARAFGLASAKRPTTTCRCGREILLTSDSSSLSSPPTTLSSPLGKRVRDDHADDDNDSKTEVKPAKRHERSLSSSPPEKNTQPHRILTGSPHAKTLSRNRPSRSSVIKLLSNRIGNVHISGTFERYCRDSRRLNNDTRSIFGLSVRNNTANETNIFSVNATDIFGTNTNFEFNLTIDSTMAIEVTSPMDLDFANDMDHDFTNNMDVEDIFASPTISPNTNATDPPAITTVSTSGRAFQRIGGHSQPLARPQPAPAPAPARPAASPKPTPAGASVGGVPISGHVFQVMPGRPRPADENYPESAMRSTIATHHPLQPATTSNPINNNKRTRRGANGDGEDKLAVTGGDMTKSVPNHRVANPTKGQLKGKKPLPGQKPRPRRGITWGENVRFVVKDTHYPQSGEMQEAVARLKFRAEVKAARAARRAEWAVEAEARERRAKGLGGEGFRGVEYGYVSHLSTDTNYDEDGDANVWFGCSDAHLGEEAAEKELQSRLDQAVRNVLDYEGEYLAILKAWRDEYEQRTGGRYLRLPDTVGRENRRLVRRVSLYRCADFIKRTGRYF
ncbi:hypothetical protein QBC41DRAFT_238022 [Cercophora samala]|uniref:Uncharacterized protein n=1 Tax=Cercophora samala TaxID=330535 RepID=A0AA39YUP4_9PEZI|nr:hypothetical protein QBC41DRAFT_238022 [Cercophora samala]